MGQSPEGASYNTQRQGEPLLNGPTEFGAVHPTAVQWTTAPTRFCRNGDILLCVRGATTGRKNVADRSFCIGRGLAAIRGKDDRAETDFIWFALDLVTDQILRETSGSTFPNLPGDKLAAVAIPLPPKSEQRRIAARLRQQLAAVTQACAAVQAQLDAARTLSPAQLRAIFSGDVLTKWPTKPLADVAEISGGVTLGRDLRGRPSRPVPYLRVANVKDGYLDLAHVKEVESTEAEIDDCRLRFGDLLLTEGGDPDKLGRGTYWQEQLPECIHQNHIFRVRFDLAGFDPAFAAAQVGSPYGKAYFLAHAKQTTGIATINRTVLSKFPFLAPPLAEQCSVAAKLEAKKTEAAHLTSLLADKLTAVDHLPAALLRDAFAGNI